LKQVQVDKVEVEKACDFIAKMQKKLQVYKSLKYEQEYKDWVKGKAPRYPLEVSLSRGSKCTWVFGL